MRFISFSMRQYSSLLVLSTLMVIMTILIAISAPAAFAIQGPAPVCSNLPCNDPSDCGSACFCNNPSDTVGTCFADQ